MRASLHPDVGEAQQQNDVMWCAICTCVIAGSTQRFGFSHLSLVLRSVPTKSRIGMNFSE
jgi:hypothetical protein